MNRIHWVLLGVLAAVAASHAYLYSRLPAAPKQLGPSAAAFGWRQPGELASEAWSAFRRLQGQPLSNLGPLGKRFRLAGTFFAFGEDSGGEGTFCKAILDDAAKKEQYLVKEGDVLDEVQVVRIYRDRVVLRNQGQEEELWLSFANALSDKAAPPRPPRKESGALTDLPALEENRFGKRVGESRWVFSRDALMAYYREMLDDPERLAQIYVSMKPDYKEGAVAGYTVDVEGETDFFRAAGLQNGDVIRKVNSMNMTSQRRAEFFIGEFAKNRLNAVVLDVERGSQPRKLIYLIR
ncbi:MAG: hypothetical protein V1873_04960 [Verrucomicrobiota bacterium]